MYVSVKLKEFSLGCTQWDWSLALITNSRACGHIQLALQVDPTEVLGLKLWPEMDNQQGRGLGALGIFNHLEIQDLLASLEPQVEHTGVAHPIRILALQGMILQFYLGEDLSHIPSQLCPCIYLLCKVSTWMDLDWLNFKLPF